MSLWEKFLRSRKARAIFRIQAGFSLFRSNLFDIQIPADTSIHLFDYLLYKKIEPNQSLQDWLSDRELH